MKKIIPIILILLFFNIQIITHYGSVYANEESQKIKLNKEIYENIKNTNNIENSNTEGNGIKNLDKKSEKQSKDVILDNGTYKIVMASHSKQSLTVDGGNKNNGVNVQLWDYLDTPQQQFDFKYDGNGYYEIIPVHSGKRLDVAGWENGANVEQWSENGGNDNQKWKIVKSESGNYNIVSKRQNLYLDVYQSKIVNGTNVQVYEKSGGKGQEFKLEKIEQHEEKPQKTVEEGTYKIVMASNLKQSLTVDGGNKNNGVNVQLWEYFNTPQQQFDFKYDGNGYYEIVPVHSGKRLDVAGWKNGANVEQWSENGGNDNQKWKIVKSESGNYNIVSKRQNLYLDVYQSKIVNGTNVQVYEKSGGKGQEFKLEKIEQHEEKPQKTVEEGTYKIVMASNLKQSLTVDGGNKNNGVNVQLWEYLDTSQQQFNLKYDGKGYYEIIPVHSGKRIDVAGWGNGANVDQWSENGGSDNQKWKIVKSESGNYNIVSKRQNLYLDVYQSKIVNGTNVQVYEKSGGKGQEFKLEKINNKSEKTISEGIYKVTPQVNRNLVFESANSNKDNNGKIQIWKDYNVRAQKLKVEYENGYYKIAMVHSEKYLTVKDEKICSGVDVIQYEWNASDNQKWIIRSMEDEKLQLIPKSNMNLVMTINGVIENGATIKLQKDEGTIYQKFSFIETFIGGSLPKFKDFDGAEKTILTSAGDVNGNNKLPMAFYKVGTGKNKLYLVFNQHGWEDAYSGDGVELVVLSQKFLEELTNGSHGDILKKWTIYVMCDANPSGIENGYDHKGTGRTVPFSGVDLNRAWPSNNWRPTNISEKGKKNYTGQNPVKDCLELRQVKELLERNRPNQNYTSILIDVHGWDCETIGDAKIGNYYNTADTFNNDLTGIDFYSKLYNHGFQHRAAFGSGYLATWAKEKLGTDYSIILELPYPQDRNNIANEVNSTTQKYDYSGRFNRGTFNILNNEAK